jgi:hypothetical protein
MPPADAEVTAPTAAVDPRALADAVQRLDVLLSQDAVEAAEVFDACQPVLAAAYGDRAGEIGRLVKRYRFEEARDLLRAAREDA